MKLYLITNASKFKGAIHVVYGMDGVLMKIDFSMTDMTPVMREKWLPYISPVEGSVADKIPSTASGVIVTLGDFEFVFDDFIKEYGYKRNTHLAKDYWPKMSKADQALAFTQASLYRKYLAKEENSWQKPMLPDKWLKTKQYLNDWKNL